MYLVRRSKPYLQLGRGNTRHRDMRSECGRSARRIICYAKVGDRLERGERYGFIRFGSRVDVYLPTDVEVKVSIGEKVTGVMTTIARM